MLYRLLKKVYHSLRTVLYLSSRSSQLGTQSSGFRLDKARPREGSFPAKTVRKDLRSARHDGGESKGEDKRTVILTLLLISLVLRDVEHGSFDRNPCWSLGVGSW
jgi:hypothetical protein